MDITFVYIVLAWKLFTYIVLAWTPTTYIVLAWTLFMGCQHFFTHRIKTMYRIDMIFLHDMYLCLYYAFFAVTHFFPKRTYIVIALGGPYLTYIVLAWKGPYRTYIVLAWKDRYIVYILAF